MKRISLAVRIQHQKMFDPQMVPGMSNYKICHYFFFTQIGYNCQLENAQWNVATQGECMDALVALGTTKMYYKT